MKYAFLHQSIRRASLIVSLCAACAPAWSCEYYAEHFQIIHPSAQLSSSTAPGIPVYMEFTQIESSDRLLGASTPVADRVELILSGEQAVELEPGREVELSPTSGYLLMHDINTELHEGRQYPLTLVFERAGAVYVEFVVGDH